MALNFSHADDSDILSISRLLSSEPDFPKILRTSTLQLLHLHLIAPRTVRYVANIPKWLLTQGIVLLHFERSLDRHCPPLTVASLLALLAEHQIKAVSKNTAVSHLTEMRSYGLLEDDQVTSDRRIRPYLLSNRGAELVRSWFDGHLASLDLLDQGNRLERSKSDAGLLYKAHPAAIRMLLGQPAWCDPPLGVATFVWAESGSNILHDLLLRVPDEHPLDGIIDVGRVRASDITGKYVISRSHAHRLFAKARELGLLDWEKPRNGGALWISPRLVEEYRAWQAVKFAAIALAWERTVKVSAKSQHGTHG